MEETEIKLNLEVSSNSVATQQDSMPHKVQETGNIDSEGLATSNDLNISDEEFNNIMKAALGTAALEKEKKVVSGIVTYVDKEKEIVLVDVGLKSEGVIPFKEFYQEGELESLQVGSTIRVYLQKLDNRYGKTVVSREKAVREESWENLRNAFTRDEMVNGIIFARVKGGLSVDLSAVIAFLPGSQVDIRPIKDITPIMGIVQPFKILNIDEKNRSVIVSRRAILEQERSGERDKFLEGILEGDVIEGTVKNITNYGVFVDLGSIDGLLHITDITWEKISHPSEVLHLGQKIKVKVVKYDHETKRLSLGMKQLLSNPWETFQDRYPIGKKIKGPVTNITDYGIFVQLESGIDGLVHISEMSWYKDGYKKYKQIELGTELEAVILDVDINKHRIALGIKQLHDNPWKTFSEAHQVGEVLEGTIKNVTDFGLFVGLEGGVDGLVHVSDLSWDNESHPEKLSQHKKGDKIKVVYLASEYENERVSLGVKQLTNDPYEKNKIAITKGEIITCTVIDVKNEGIEVELANHARIFIKKSELARERVEQRADRFVVGDRIDTKVVAFDELTKKASLSIKALEEDEHKRAIKEYGSTDSGATLGSILGDALKNVNKEDKKS